VILGDNLILSAEEGISPLNIFGQDQKKCKIINRIDLFVRWLSGLSSLSDAMPVPPLVDLDALIFKTKQLGSDNAGGG
jgi:hypothetical protein